MTAARLTVTAFDPSSQQYELYAMKRAWSESSATWNLAASGTPWAIPGAKGATDRGTTVLGTITPSANGTATITLNAAGVSVVQGWVNGAASNFGLIIADPANSNGADLRSSEYGTISARPTLTITYQ